MGIAGNYSRLQVSFFFMALYCLLLTTHSLSVPLCFCKISLLALAQTSHSSVPFAPPFSSIYPKDAGSNVFLTYCKHSPGKAQNLSCFLTITIQSTLLLCSPPKTGCWKFQLYMISLLPQSSQKSIPPRLPMTPMLPNSLRAFSTHIIPSHCSLPPGWSLLLTTVLFWIL